VTPGARRSLGEAAGRGDAAVGYAVMRYEHAADFLERAGPWLLAREAEHNLLLGIARSVAAGDHPFEEPIYLATVESEGRVVGCAFRTPPHKLGLTRLPEEAISAVVESVHRVYDQLPAVFGEAGVARAFADAWSDRTGAPTRTGMRQRLHVLDEVTPPSRPAAGEMRVVTEADDAPVRRWLADFERDAAVPVGDRDAVVDGLVRHGRLAVWIDAGEPRAMAAVSGLGPRTARLGYVFTPERFRGRGYATSLVAALSQRMLDTGVERLVLYTDLGNPTSNVIYRRVGYRTLLDVQDVDFVPETPDGAEAAGPGQERGPSSAG